MTPDLSRRDAMVALGSAGVATAGLGALAWETLEEDEESTTPTDRETLVAAAEALYPSEVSGIPEFVETYVVGRLQDRPEHREGVMSAARAVDEYARQWHDDHYAELDRETRQAVFDDMTVDAADPDPDGAKRQRIRYYLVNELLYAFYATPTGAKLVGLENPQGYPGGTESYRRGP